MAKLKPPLARSRLGSPSPLDCGAVLAAFNAAWERGEAPAAEDYLGRLDPADSQAAVDLIYREFCLSEAGGLKPELAQYLSRFPQHASALERLIGLHDECSPSLLGRWMETTPSLDVLPMVGDEVGPFLLVRELGSGGFARVFLAEQTNLENRLVVLKVSTRMTREPWLLARVRHAHIVEIVSHATVDDGAFHLICMPFWGGATLAAVLSEIREKGNRPNSGNDLLVALDSVAASEFPTIHAARPAREILTGLTYGQAVAWVVARLAEALDFAFSRDVAHGDVKPSNILLSADANPLLLDFNLARDSSPTGRSRSVEDPGGTLAYMAPERLHGIMPFGPIPGDSSAIQQQTELDSRQSFKVVSGSQSEPSQCDPDSGPHRADIYSLGMVMLEALTGQPPVSGSASRVSVPETDIGWTRADANGSAVSCVGGVTAAIRESEARGGRAIAPGLRAILERCLDPDPSARYRRGLELAEDLDRWRTERPLVFTAEPFWGLTVRRVLRRQRRALLTAAVSLAVILVTTAVALLNSHQTLQAVGKHKLGRIWDDPEAHAVRFQRTNAPRLLQFDDSRVETAIHALKEYNLLDPTDWRRRDDVRALPEPERDDLEVWLMEQVYLYCRALENRPGSPDDWRRALNVLGHVGGTAPIPALMALRHRLNVKLGAEAPKSTPDSAFQSTAKERSRIDEYLLGVVAECEAESNDQGHLRGVDGPTGRGTSSNEMSRDAGDRTRLAALRALEHYHNYLEFHPDSFWGHYRASSVAYGLGGSQYIAEAADHLEQCLERRPNNPTLHHHRAVCLMGLDQYGEAQREVEIAIERAPDIAEFFRTRATIRANLRQAGGLAEDLQHFELLTHVLPRAFWDHSRRADSDVSPGSSVGPALPFQGTFDLEARRDDRVAQIEGNGNTVETDYAEFGARVGLAHAIRQAGELDLAEGEFSKLRVLEPDHIGVRMTCAIHFIEAGRLDDALPDLNAILYHPGLAEYLRTEPVTLARFRDPNHRTLLGNFHDASRRYCASGKLEVGRAIARRAVDLAIELRHPRGMSHYNMARAYADSAPGNPTYVVPAAYQLFRAFVANPLYKEKYLHDSTFDAIRVSIDAWLDRQPDPSDEYRRRLVGMSTVRGR